MCGISGYISRRNFLPKNNIKNTLKLMKRRGPDAQGFFSKDYLDSELALLHSRLNIIDLKSRSNQPFYSDDLILIFNGEIYNYLELREKLKKKYFFKTNSDTEVLLNCYKEFGEDCVNYFNGMWSFAIWDLKKKKLFLSRDPFGEKPLFYFKNRNGFFFGSEIKFIQSLCIHKFKVNDKQIYKNLFLGYKSLHKTNETFHENIYSLNSGTNLTIDFNLKIKKKKYWSPKIKINHKMNLNEAAEETRYLLMNSLKLRMRSDVKIAFCLSGGIDSGLLASIAKKKLKKKISTFSIIDKDIRYNEKYNIDVVNNDLKTNKNLIYLKQNKNIFFDRIKKLTNYHDSPIATISYYIHSFLTEKISKKNFKVSISGVGADELFTGYYDHYLHHLQTLNNTKYYKQNLQAWKNYVRPFLRNKSLKNHLTYINDPTNRDIIYEKNFNLNKFSKNKKSFEFEEKYFCSELLRNRMMNELFFEVVPVILKHDDLNSMYNSIENRSPYLDRNLLEFALTIPPNLLIKNGFQKNVLRESAKGILHEKIRINRSKKGFNASITSLIDLNDKQTINLIFDKKNPISDIIDFKKIKSQISKKNIPNHISKFIFSLISSKIFYENN